MEANGLEKAYVNDMLARLEELTYYELSGCCAHKVEFVGIDWIQAKNIKAGPIDVVIPSTIKAVKDAGLVKDMTYAIHGYGIMLNLIIKGCVHMSKETTLKKHGVRPYMCPITNMILDQIIEKCKYEDGLIADGLGNFTIIDEKNGVCDVVCAIYETADKIGQVSDWTQWRKKV